MNVTTSVGTAWISIGVIARNEEKSIGPALGSLFRQSLFAELAQRGRQAEILCVANGCTDATVEIATRVFEEQAARHPHRHAFIGRTLAVPEAGKINAWNLFVHRMSASGARYLILMDADILFGHFTTLWNLCRALERDDRAQIASGEPVKDLALKKNPSPRERLSLATSHLTRSCTAQLTGQLYCIRTTTARRIHLPRALAACEDGFIKSLVCTDFLTKPPQPGRIVRVPHASHIFEAYVSGRDILRNQKRQMIGQTFVHVLIDQFLPSLPAADQANLQQKLQQLDAEEGRWLERLMAAHLRRTRHFWQLFPGILTFRFHRLAGLPAGKKLLYFPATLAGLGVTLAACWLAAVALRRDELDCWPGKRGPGPGREDGPMDLSPPVVSG